MATKVKSTRKAASAKNVERDTTTPLHPIMELFINGIQDMYWAENHLVKALPKMRSESASKELQSAIADHLEVTKGQVARLEQVFELIGHQARARKCDAMEGLTLEGEGTIEDTVEGTPVRDLGINMSCQKVEQYEIASYTGLIALANSLGLPEVAELLNANLQEEQESLDLLSSMSEEITARSLQAN
jgi:ferritin-like metal-binding protein YciE